MRVGLISDSHGKCGKLKLAMEALARRGVEAIVHCGDVGSTRIVEMLASAAVPVYVVSGNMDRHIDRLEAAAAAGNVNFQWEVITVPVGDGKYLAATHGNDPGVLRQLIREDRFSYVCHGHTHAASDSRVGKVRVINPGALHHPRQSRRPTIAVLDTSNDSLEQIEIE